MAWTPHLQVAALAQAVDMFKASFSAQYPNSRLLIDGEDYEDEDLDLNIDIDGDQLELETYAVTVSHMVQQATGYFILPFVLPTARYEAHGSDSRCRRK